MRERGFPPCPRSPPEVLKNLTGNRIFPNHGTSPKQRTRDSASCPPAHAGSDWDVLGLAGGEGSPSLTVGGLPRGGGAPWGSEGKTRKRQVSGSQVGKISQPMMLGVGGSVPKVEGSRQGGGPLYNEGGGTDAPATPGVAGSRSHGSHFLSPGPPRLHMTPSPAHTRTWPPRGPSLLGASVSLRGPSCSRARVWQAGGAGGSPVGAAGSVPIAGGEEGLVYTLHKGLGHRALGSPDNTHPASVGAGTDGARVSAGGSRGWDPPALEPRGAGDPGGGFPNGTLSRGCRETPDPRALGAAPGEG